MKLTGSVPEWDVLIVPFAHSTTKQNHAFSVHYVGFLLWDYWLPFVVLHMEHDPDPDSYYAHIKIVWIALLSSSLDGAATYLRNE